MYSPNPPLLTEIGLVEVTCAPVISLRDVAFGKPALATYVWLALRVTVTEDWLVPAQFQFALGGPAIVTCVLSSVAITETNPPGSPEFLKLAVPSIIPA